MFTNATNSDFKSLKIIHNPFITKCCDYNLCLLRTKLLAFVASNFVRSKQLRSLKDRALESGYVQGGKVNKSAKGGSLKDAPYHLTDSVRGTWLLEMFGYARQEGMGKEALSTHSQVQ